jgi:hypothetical protein
MGGTRQKNGEDKGGDESKEFHGFGIHCLAFDFLFFLAFGAPSPSGFFVGSICLRAA